MTQFNPMPPPIPPGGPGGVVAFSPQPPRMPSTSGLAVASLVCALIFFCPIITPLLAILFGVIALISISRSAGRKRGTGVAAAGLVIGSLVLLMQAAIGVISYTVTQQFIRGVEQRFESFVLNVEGGQFGEARAKLTADAQKKAGRSSHRELAALLAKDYGAFKSVAFDWGSEVYHRGVPQPAIPVSPIAVAINSARGSQAAAGLVYSLPIKVEFSKAGTVYGQLTLKTMASAAVAGSQSVAAATPLAIDSFTLVGPNGPWTFPFPPAHAPAPTTMTAPGSDPDAGVDSEGSDGGT